MTEAESAERAGAGTRAVALTVIAVIEEGHDAKSVVLEIPDEHRARFDYRPGQFLTMRVPSDLTGSAARCYSLASSPHTDATHKVTIKRTNGGYVSNWLCDNVSVGDTIDTLPPAGQFTPADLDADFLLWAAGSGITPVMSILKSALAAGTGRVVLCYANRDERSVIFASELRDLAARYAGRLTALHWLESIQGLPTRAQLGGFARMFTSYQSFVCGPEPFMAVVKEALREAGVPRENIHLEVFQSLTGDPFEVPVEDLADDTEAADADVTIDGQTHRLCWPKSHNLVDVMLTAAIDVPFSCREGNCGSCAATLVEGQVDLGNAAILEPEDIAEGLFLACQARPVSDKLIVEF